MTTSRTYPEGVPSWVDVDSPDPESAQAFYGGLFGWAFERVGPPQAPFYAIASLGGRDAAGVGQAPAGTPAAWNMYVAVEDADAVATGVAAAGGMVLQSPADAGPAGRMAICADPSGVAFRLWQAGDRLGAQAVNEPGAWNFSELCTDDPAAVRFYAELLRWSIEDLGFATMIRRPGYGDHLQATVDPGIRERQSGAMVPPGFADAVGWVHPLRPGTAPHWHTSFTVADRDATAARATELGGEVLATQDADWTRTALVRDPDGATFTASQSTPPSD